MIAIRVFETKCHGCGKFTDHVGYDAARVRCHHCGSANTYNDLVDGYGCNVCGRSDRDE